jgi:hypothetical protein
VHLSFSGADSAAKTITPAIQSVIWAASQGDSNGITPKELQRFLGRVRAEPQSENRLISWGPGASAGHRVVRNTVVSDHEVLVRLEAADPSTNQVRELF